MDGVEDGGVTGGYGGKGADGMKAGSSLFFPAKWLVNFQI